MNREDGRKKITIGYMKDKIAKGAAEVALGLPFVYTAYRGFEYARALALSNPNPDVSNLVFLFGCALPALAASVPIGFGALNLLDSKQTYVRGDYEKSPWDKDKIYIPRSLDEFDDDLKKRGIAEMYQNYQHVLSFDFPLDKSQISRLSDEVSSLSDYSFRDIKKRGKYTWHGFYDNSREERKLNREEMEVRNFDFESEFSSYLDSESAPEKVSGNGRVDFVSRYRPHDILNIIARSPTIKEACMERLKDRISGEDVDRLLDHLFS